MEITTEKTSFLTRPYERLSIEKLKPEFTGWEHYIELLEQIPDTTSTNPERDQAFFAILFELGCRAREVLGLRVKVGKRQYKYLSPPLMRKNFLFTKPGKIIITDIPVLKRYEKIDHKILKEAEIPHTTPPSHKKLWHKTEQGLYVRKVWVTRRLRVTRRIEIPDDEPLLDYVLPWVKKCRGQLFDRYYHYYYYLCRELDPLKDKYPRVPDHIFPHWWRSQRACQLAAEYGFTLHELLEFFEWQSMTVAKEYAKLAGKLGDKMAKAKTTWRQKIAKPKPRVKEKQTTVPKVIPEEPSRIDKTKEEKKEKEEEMIDIFSLLSKTK